ncbi:poly(ADP-ribose) glycohydrolase [Spinachia spinachia]
MAGHDHRNNSSQIRGELQGEGQAPPGPSPSSPPSSPAAVRRRQGEAGEEARRGAPPSCCALADLKHLPHRQERRGRLTFSKTDAVLVNVEVFNGEGRLVPQQGADMWNSSVVKMPCSPSSLRVKPGSPWKARRWEVISEQLGALARKTAASAEDVEGAVMKYNPRYKDQWSFDALCRFVKIIPDTENYFPKLFPKMAALALRLPDYVKQSIQLLRRGKTASVTLSQVQISCLLANAFFCTFPHRNTTSSTAEYHNYPSINFTGLLGQWSERKKEKLRAVLHYFHVMTEEKTRIWSTGGVFRCSCKEKMNRLYVSSHGTIETEGTGLLQVDFASSWIGGGVLGSGLVQEEILFLMNPELIVSRLFTERLADNECLVVTGSQQFSSYSGFGDSFEWAGPHKDTLLRDRWARLQRRIVAIDAMHFKLRRDQYNMIGVRRELNKAFCGFRRRDHDEPDIATGKWGCGAFNGDPQLKATIQLMAAAAAGRGWAFFTFRDEELELGLRRTHRLLVEEGVTRSCSDSWRTSAPRSGRPAASAWTCSTSSRPASGPPGVSCDDSNPTEMLWYGDGELLFGFCWW